MEANTGRRLDVDIKRIFTHWPFRRKLLLILLIIFLPALAIIVASGLSNRKDEIVRAQKNALFLTQSLAAQQEQIAIATKTMLSILAQLPEVRSLDGPACNQLFRDLRQQYPFYATILAVKPDGTVFAASSPFEPNVNMSDRKHFKDAIRTLDFSVGEYIVGRIIKKTNLISYAFPVLDAKQKPVAILIAAFALEEFSRFISAVNLPEGSVVVITDYKGIRLYRLPENDATPIGKLISERFPDPISGKAEEGVFDWKGLDGVTRIEAFMQVRLREDLPPYLYIIVGLPKNPILHKANMNMLGNLAILGIAGLLAMSLAWVFGNLVLINPINRLVAATQRFGMGEMGTRTGLPHSPDELGRLARSFDDMASLLETRDIERERAEEALNKAYAEMEERVQERTAELTASNAAMMVEISERNQAEEALRDNEQKYRLLTATVPAVVFRGNSDGAVEFFDDKVAEMVGYEKEVFNSGHLKWTDLIYQEDLEPGKAILLHALRTKGFYVREYRVRHRDDRLIWIQERSQIVLNQQGKIDYISGVFFDITDRRQTENALRSSKEELTSTVQALEKRNYELTLLSEMGDMLQSCASAAEAHGVLGKFLQQIFPEDAGTLSVIDGGSKLLKVVVVWGGIPITQEVFPKEECWALRTGRIFGTSERHAGLCHHPDAPRGVEFLCLPMVAQGDALGVLRLQCQVSTPCMDESKRQLAVTVAEHANLALANLLLRETLHHQSIRDPLTGLYNRRYLEEAMEREIYRAERHQSSLGLIMLDVDHFKQFNDRFGHDAGDELLRELGKFLIAKVRPTDIACRYGGEEFLVILPETTLAAVVNKAEQLREKCKRLTIVYQGRILGRTTISLGVAAFPEHGITPQALIQTVDKALYQAKEEGRDRLVVAPVVLEEAESAAESGAVAAS